MWNRISQVAGFGTNLPEDEQSQEEIANEKSEVEEQVEQQRLEIEQMKALLRENEEQSKEKDNQLAELSSKLKRLQIQSKAKITSLTKQLEEKAPKKDEGDFDDASSSDSSDCSTRGKIILLRKQLETSKQQLEKKDRENLDVIKRYEVRIKDLELQLEERRNESLDKTSEQVPSSEKGPPQGSDIHEMYAQMVYKDSKILELNNHILELERNVLDLQEHVREKEEVLQSRNLAVQLMSADMSRKGKSVVDELEETRSQMKLMQTNFADIEHHWKSETELLKAEMATTKEDLMGQISAKDALIANLESSLKKGEAVRYELATKNAELQKKMVLMEERSDKLMGKQHEKLEQELIMLRENLNEEKGKSAELQKALDELSNQSESKVFKARVKERTKLKALERELKELKSLQLKEQKTEEVTKLQQQVALLEEEKGTLQLRLIEMDEQISTQENLKTKNGELLASLKKKKEKIHSLEDHVKNLEAGKEILSKQVSEQEKSITELMECLKDAKAKSLVLDQELQESRRSIEDMKNHINELEKNIKELLAENEKLSDEITSQKEEKVSMGVKIIELEEIHENDEKQKEELQQKLEELESMFNSSSEHRVVEEKLALEAKCAKLLELIDSSNSSKESFSQQVEFLKTELEKNQLLLTEASKKNDEYNIKIGWYETQLEELKEMCENKKDQCISLTNTVTDLQNSLKAVLSLGSCESIQDFQTLWEKRDQELKKYSVDSEIYEQHQRELEISLQVKEHECSTLSEEIKFLQQQLEHQEHSFKEEKNAFNDQLKQESDMRNKFERTVFEKDEIINVLKNSLQENESVMDKMKEDAKTQMQSMSQMREERNLAKAQVDELMEKLSCEAEKRQSKISSLLEQISDLETEVSSLNEELSRYRDREGSICDELVNLKQLYDGSVQECDQLKSQYHTECEEKNALTLSFQEKISYLNSSFIEEKAKLEELHKEEIKKCQAEVRDTSKHCSESIKELENFKMELEGENENLKQKLLTKEENIKLLNETIHSLEKQLNETMGELAKEKSNSQKLAEELNYGRAQITQLQESASTFELSLKEAENSLTEQNLELSERNKKLVEELEELKLVNCALKESSKEMENLQNRFMELSTQNDVLSHENDVFKGALSESSKEIEDLKNHCTDLSTQNDALSHENDVLKGEVSEHADLKVKLEDLLSNSAKKQSELEEKLHSKQMTLDEYAAAKLDLESEIESLQNSLQSNRHELELLQSEFEKANCEKIQYKTDNEQLNLVVESASAQLEEQKKLSMLLSQELEAIKESSEQSDSLTYELSFAKKKLEKNVEDMKALLDNLNFQNSKYAGEVASLKSTVEVFKEILSHSELFDLDESSSIEVTLQNVIEKYKLLNEFKNQCCGVLDELSDSVNQNMSVKFENTDSISNYFNNARLKIDNLKSQLSSHVLHIEQLELEVKQLNDRNSQITDDYSEMKQQYCDLESSFDNLHQEHKICLLSLNDLLYKVTSVEQSCAERFQLMLNRLETLNHVVMKLLLSKEQIKQLYLSYREHNQVLKDKAIAYEEELENLRLNSHSEQETLTDIVHALKGDIADKEHLIEGLREEAAQAHSNSELITSLKMELKSLTVSNEQLVAQVKQNEENYLNNLTNLKSTLHRYSSIVLALKEQLLELRKNVVILCDDETKHFTNASLLVTQILNETEHLQLSFIKTTEENTSLQTSVSSYSNEVNKLQQQNTQLQQELQAVKQSLTASGANSKLVQEQQLQISTLENDMESLKLEMERCISEKSSVENELDSLKSAQSESAVLTCRYNALKKFVQNASTSLNNEFDEMQHDSSLPFFSDSLEDDSTLVTHFQSELIGNLKRKKQLADENSCLQNKIVALENEIKEVSASLGLQIDKNEALDVLVTSLESDLKSLQEAMSNKAVSEKFIQTESSGISIDEHITPSKRAIEFLQHASNVEEMSEKASVSIDDEKQKLREELDSSKIKYDKMLMKLKVFKNKIDKLNAEVQELTAANGTLKSEAADLQQKLLDVNNECTKLNKDLSTSKKEQEVKVTEMESRIAALQEEKSCLDKNNEMLQAEVLQLQALCREKEMAVFQQEDSSRLLRLKLEENYDRVTSLEASYRDQKSMFEEAVIEKQQLTSKLQSLQEQASMLISDNETYQSVVEKLNHSNASLKNELKILSENCHRDMEKLKKQCISETQNQLKSLKEALCQSQSLQTELQHKLDNLTFSYNDLVEQLKVSQQNCQTHTEEIISLRKTVVDLTSKKPTAFNVDASVQHSPSLGTTSESSQTDTEVESEPSRVQINHLNQELQLAHNTIQQWCEAEKSWKSKFNEMESFYQKTIAELQKTLAIVSETPAHAKEQLEMELQQALGSLHKKSVQCEELNAEISKLLEERNSLKLKLSQFHQFQFQQQEIRKEDIALQRSSEVPLDSVKVEMPSEVIRDSHQQSEIATLHQRLLEAEKTCRELRKANEALDSSLAVEREQRQMVEEELGYAQRQLLPMDKGAKDEYHLLLEDFNEPEMFLEKNFSITREVKSRAHKLRKWLRGRRLYLHRICQRKKYSEIIYIFYICAIHLWLLLCLVRHS